MEASILFSKIWGILVLFRRAPKTLYFLRNSFSLRFREKSPQIKTFSRKVFFMFCLDHFSLNCVIKMSNLKVNDPLKGSSLTGHRICVYLETCVDIYYILQYFYRKIIYLSEVSTFYNPGQRVLSIQKNEKITRTVHILK